MFLKYAEDYLGDGWKIGRMLDCWMKIGRDDAAYGEEKNPWTDARELLKRGSLMRWVLHRTKTWGKTMHIAIVKYQ